MRYWFIITLFFFLMNSQAQELSISQIRELYLEASFDEDAAKKLFELTENSSIETEYLRYTYYAVSQMLQSKFSINPLDKLKAFKQGKEKLEKVINLYPEDIELRFLRFCVQDGTPQFLDYKSNMKEDSDLINKTISTSSEELQKFITPIFKSLNDGRTSYSSK